MGASLLTAAAIAKERGITVEVLDVLELNLPTFIPNREIEAFALDQQPGIRHVLDVCRRSDAMIWSSPTYHGTMSDVIKNAIDFTELLANDSRPYLQGCAVGLVAVNDNTPFTTIAHELPAWLAPTKVMVTKATFAEDLICTDERCYTYLVRLVNELLAFVKDRES
jgi:FMN reductase